MWREKQAELLRNEIEAILGPLAGAEGFYELLRQPLAESRRGLAIEKEQLRPLLPLMVCDGICGKYEHAVPAAAALQLLLAAGDVFDDIEDADSSQSLAARSGTAQATNAASALLILAEGALARLAERGVEHQTIVRILGVVNASYATACSGQYLDLLLDSHPIVSEEECLQVMAMKSATQVQCACQVGALLATDRPGLLDTFSEFGHNLGMAAQIANDIQGITRGSDIAKRKKTLPVVYALEQAEGNVLQLLQAAYAKEPCSAPDPEQVRALLFQVGAVHYAMIKLELFRQQALDALHEAQRAGAQVERLQLLLP